MLSIQDRQETFQDVEFAVSALQSISNCIPEDAMNESLITLPAMQVRSCLELLLSMLESYEGLQVQPIEDWYKANQQEYSKHYQKGDNQQYEAMIH